MRKIVALLIAASLAVAAAPLTLTVEGEPLAIIGPDAAPSCSLVKLEAKGVAKDAAYRWRVVPEDGVQKADTAPHLLQFTAKDGTYAVDLLVVRLEGGAPRIYEATKKVVVGGSPDPGPGPTKDIRAAIGRVRFGNAGCTATVVHPRRPDGRWDVVCAAHCVSDVGQTGAIELKDGRTVALVVTVIDRRADISWFATVSKTIDSLPSAILATSTPPPGTPISHSGYGFDQPGNEEHGTVAGPLTPDGQLPCDLSVSSGDSGGSIYRRDNKEIVATVCCTTRIAGFARMYGGGCVRAGQLRPRGEVAELLEWHPCPIPELKPGEKPGTGHNP